MGIPNKLVGAARPYVEVRQSLVDDLEARNPLWAEDYNTQDPKWEKRIEGMRVIADDDRFIGRSDIQALRDYLAARDEITGMFGRNGTPDLPRDALHRKADEIDRQIREPNHHSETRCCDNDWWRHYCRNVSPPIHVPFALQY